MSQRMRIASTAHLDKKRTVILLRSVVIFTTSYLVLFGGHALSLSNVGYVAALVLSNAALAWCPRVVFDAPQFAAVLLLGDTALVLLGLYQTVGFSQEFLIVYFFTIFLTTAAESLAQIAVGATLISGLYGYWLWLSTAGPLDASHWLRLPFFFVVAIFYAFLTDELKVERRRREQAEREREHLRLLLQVAGTTEGAAITSECTTGIRTFIESAFPHLRCSVRLNGAALEDEPGALALSIEAYGERFGVVTVRCEGGAVSDTERTMCALVIHAVASALYTARQVEVARVASRLKEEFLATLSHELRTPLHAIIGYSDLVEGAIDPAADPMIAEGISRVRVNAQRLHDLLEEMLGFASLRAGHTQPMMAPMPIEGLVGEMAAYVKDLLTGRPIDVQVDLPADPPTIVTDYLKLRQVLRSVLSNAAKFTEEGRVRLVVARRGEDHISISISDTGIGISPADLHIIFDDFRQIDGSSTRRFGGVGLGLALARAMISVLGGTLEANSRVGEGSTFRILLPIGGVGLNDTRGGARLTRSTLSHDGASEGGWATV